MTTTALPALPVGVAPVVGTEFAGCDHPITRADLRTFAVAANDPNPIHLDDAAAHALGLPTVVAHGMLTMSLASGYVAALVGDPGRVQEFAVRFTAPVFVPTEAPAVLRVQGRVRSVDEESGTACIAVTATSGGKRVFGRAFATVAWR